MFGLGEAVLGNLFALSAGLLLFVATGPLMAPLKDMKPAKGLAALSVGVAIAIALILLPLPGHDHSHIADGQDHHDHEHDHATNAKSELR